MPNLKQTLPNFSSISYDSVQSELEAILANNRLELERLLSAKSHYTWANLLAPLEEADDQLHRFWSRISHLNSVRHCDKIRSVYESCIPLLSAYGTELSQHEGLYQAIVHIGSSFEYDALTTSQKKSIEYALRDFRLAGVHLSKPDKKIVAELSESLATLSTQFSNHVLDATQAWSLSVTDESQLAGIPEHVCAMAKAKAESSNKEGWCFSLDFPVYYAVMSQAEDRSVRESMYRAYVTRASDVGPNAGEFDNSPIMQAMLDKRFSLAEVLGFDNYAHYALATRMVKKPEDVISFIDTLAKPSVKKAKEELSALEAFSKESLEIDTLSAWDVAFASERLRQDQYDVSQEALRPYFPFHQVQEALFDTIQRLFGIKANVIENCDAWHDDVMLYSLSDAEGKLRSYCYIDVYARSDKQGGAWMNDLQGKRKRVDGSEQLPIALVNCNFMPPDGDRPSLLTFDDVETLFHEFGHALQHMLTTVDSAADVAGISGIPWDAVEFPSQFMEHWAWDRSVMTQMAKHYETKEPLSETMMDNMNRARHFQSAMRMARQLEFSWFDMALHTQTSFSEDSVIDTLKKAESQFAVVSACDPYRFPHTFSHLFAGGYAAGYYSYKWAEVMAVDAYHLFQARGGFDKKTAHDFLRYVLEPGGSEEPEVLFRQFADRDPDPMVLLYHDGILQKG